MNTSSPDSVHIPVRYMQIKKQMELDNVEDPSDIMNSLVHRCSKLHTLEKYFPFLSPASHLSVIIHNRIIMCLNFIRRK